MRNWDHVYSTLERLARAPQAREDPVILAPTDAAYHGWVMKVMDYLRLLGYQNVNFKQ
jgi:biopolymer transport protein ExbD